jgi:2-amino-4-hydroxy-6-hydroxymethyldihydropteridine diphosphokinase
MSFSPCRMALAPQQTTDARHERPESRTLMRPLALLGLGSNLGDRKANLDGAIAALRQMPGVNLRDVSSYHETPAVGGPAGQGPFLNAVATAEPTLEPHALLEDLRVIESRFGRQRTVRWGERTLDLDLLLFGDQVIETAELMVPHPRLVFRRFVLAPAAEVAPRAVEPWTRRTVSDLLANLDRRPSLVALVDANPLSVPESGGWSNVLEPVFHSLVKRLGAIGLYSSERMALDRLSEGDADERWLVADSAVCRVIEPTFVVVSPETDRGALMRHEPGTPILIPESHDPGQIVLEILATCAATRS